MSGHSHFNSIGGNPDDPDFDPESEKLIAKFADTMRNGYFRRDLMRAVAKPGWFEE